MKLITFSNLKLSVPFFPEPSVGCGFPGAPAHSTVEFSTQSVGPGTVARYSCDRGFELLGPARRICNSNGTWVPQGIPFCGKLQKNLKWVFFWTTTLVRTWMKRTFNSWVGYTIQNHNFFGTFGKRNWNILDFGMTYTLLIYMSRSQLLCCRTFSSSRVHILMREAEKNILVLPESY